MKRFLLMWVGVLALSLVAGCLKTTQVITLNPDGSGKVVFTSVKPSQNLLMNAMGAGDDTLDPDPAKTAREALRGFIISCRSADAWANLTCKSTVDGGVEMTGVCYFADFNKLVRNSSFGAGGPYPKWTATGKAGMLEIKLKDETEPTSEPDQKAKTDQEVAAAVEEYKARFQKEREMMAPMIRTAKLDITFSLPGTLEDIEGLTRTDSRGVRLLIEGQRVLEFMDRVMADDRQLAAAIRAGRDIDRDGPDPGVVMEGLFGKGTKALKATCTDMKPQFDYQAEMAKAKAGQADMLKKLGIDLDAKPADNPPARKGN